MKIRISLLLCLTLFPLRLMYLIPQAAINSYPAGSTLTQNPTSN